MVWTLILTERYFLNLSLHGFSCHVAVKILMMCLSAMSFFPTVSRITLLSSLESGFRSSWNHLPLLVKIIHKSRLRFYGKFGLKIDYPYQVSTNRGAAATKWSLLFLISCSVCIFQAYFEVADQSGIMSLVLWNELCPEFYQRLNVGTVLYLQSYSLKPSYPNRTRPQMDHHRMKSFNSLGMCLTTDQHLDI